MLKTPSNPTGNPIAVLDGLRASVQADRSQIWKDFSLPFYGYNRADAKVSEGVLESFWLQGMMADFPAAYFCIRHRSDCFRCFLKRQLVSRATERGRLRHPLRSSRQL
jgi:non-heme chloroperoxidase